MSALIAMEIGREMDDGLSALGSIKERIKRRSIWAVAVIRDGRIDAPTQSFEATAPPIKADIPKEISEK